LNGRVVFSAGEEVHGREIWQSDGTEAGTTMIADICPGTCTSVPRLLRAAGGALYFAADDGSGSQAWRSDGTAAGTVALGAFVNPQQFVGLGGKVIFFERLLQWHYRLVPDVVDRRYAGGRGRRQGPRQW
jgi:ELWxxDGT repeat protein